MASALCRSRRAQAGSGGLPTACHEGSGSSRGAPVHDDDARIAGACRLARGGRGGWGGCGGGGGRGGGGGGGGGGRGVGAGSGPPPPGGRGGGGGGPRPK